MCDWVSLADAAELEDITYNACKLRYLDNKYKGKTEPNPQGGRDLVFIDVSTLSPRAQQKRRRRLYEADAKQRAEKLRASGEPPWYVTVDFMWYHTNYKQKYLEAVSLCCTIEKYFKQAEEHYKERTEFCERFVAENLDISSKQFRRYCKRYKEGLRWAEARLVETGENYDILRILALCPPPKKGKAAKMTAEILADIENLWARKEYHENLQTRQMLYDDLVSRLKSRGEEYIPSYTTVRRYLDCISYNNADVKTLLQKGVSGFKHSKMIKKRRDITKLQVMELVMGDAHTFDCWVEYTNDNGTKIAIRPYLVGFIDVRSRALVGWGICYQPNAEVIKQVLIHMVYPKKGSPICGVPRVVYIDNGKDFTAETLTGRKRAERFDIDGEVKGFYKCMGVEYDKRALPYQPWTKGQIERCFLTIIQRFSKRFPSYTGTLTGSRTDAKVKKDIKGMLERGELYTMDEFSAMFESYLETDYNQHNHGGLKEDGVKIPTPAWAFEHLDRYNKAAPPMDYVITLIGRAEVRTVYNYGIEICGRTYMSESLAKYIGEKIKVRYYKNCTDFVCCTTLTGEKICNAYTADKLDPLADQDDETLTEHLKAQKRQLKRAKTDAEALRTPFVQRELQLPELSDEVPKVVAIPQDRQYAAEQVKKAEKSKVSNKKKYDNEFMRAQAQKAFDRIAKLG